MKRKQNIFTSISVADNTMYYLGEVRGDIIYDANSKDVLNTFHSLFKEGDIVDVRIGKMDKPNKAKRPTLDMAIVEKTWDNLQGLQLTYKDFAETAEYFFNLGLGVRDE